MTVDNDLNSKPRRGRRRTARRNPVAWTNGIFRARQVQKGGVLRRSVAAVERFGSEAALIDAVQQRDFHLLQCGGNYIILCNTGRLVLLR